MVVVQPPGWQEPEEDEQALESSEVEVRSLVVGVTQHGVRLDKALAELVPELSRSYLQQLLGLGLVRLNGVASLKPAHKVKAGDALIALASSGPHSNGYSLIRKILEVSKADLQQTVGDKSLADALRWINGADGAA